VRVAGGAEAEDAQVDLEGRFLLPALVNAHDVLDLSTLPPLGRPPHASLYEWTEAAEEDLLHLAPALAVPLVDRLFLGGMRNLLAGVAAVLHHHPDHRSLSQVCFPVRVQRRYGFAHSPGLTPALRKTYRTSDRRIPWLVRAVEGALPGLRAELDVLAAANVLRQNTVIVHGTALEPEDAERLASARASVVWCPESDRRLYGRTTPFAALRGGGVSVGLGSDAPSAGARDALSNLAAARREGVLDEPALLRLATGDSAAVARLAPGGFFEGAPADLLAVDSLERLLEGDRLAVSLLLVRGEIACGDPLLLGQAGRATVEISLDGGRRALAGPLARRLATILRRHPSARGAQWLSGVEL
jgi:cytosine/adenosine deaminase-related metal-dependent hydrolase